MVTNARPHEIEAVFHAQKVKTNVGKSYGVVLVDGYEVATYRQEQYAGLDSKKCEVKFVETIKEDLGRRDLTINAMAFCDQTGDLIDPFGGREDLSKKLIRFVGDPQERIHEDPNRIIRACRFFAKLDGRFDPGTFTALKEHAHFIREYVHPDRIRKEIMKAMKIPKASKFFYALHEIGVLQYIFPSMEKCFNLSHGRHHLEDVFEHLMLCGDSLHPRDPILKLTGYCHDVGKYLAYNENSQTREIDFIGHEKVGAELLRTELETLRFSKKDTDRIVTLTQMHMRTLDSDLSPRAVRRLLHAFEEKGIGYQDFFRLRLADHSANLAKSPLPLKSLKALLWAVSRERQETPFSVQDLAVNGHDVMRTIGIKPGPLVGEALQRLFEFVLTNGAEVNNKETLMAQLQSPEMPAAKKRNTLPSPG